MSEGNQLKRAASADSGSEAQHRSKNACVRDAQEGTDEAKGMCCSALDKTGSPQGGQVVELTAFANASFTAGAPLRSVESTGDPHGDDSEPDSPRVTLLVGSVPEPAGDLDALLLAPAIEPTTLQHDEGAPLGPPGTTSEALMQDGEENAANQQQKADMRAESAGQMVRDAVTAHAVSSEELPQLQQPQEQRGQVVPNNATAGDAAGASTAAGPAFVDSGPTPGDASLAADAPASAVAAPVAVAAPPAAAAALAAAGPAPAPNDHDDDTGSGDAGPAPDDEEAGPALDNDDASIGYDDGDDEVADEEAAMLGQAHAYSAHLADLHHAAWAQPSRSRRQWAALIAPDRLWDTCPGQDQCSIVLDTETSGLPRSFGGWTRTRYQCLPAYDTCRIVSVAWQVLGPPPGLQSLHQGYLLVRRDGWDIEQKAIEIHGITNEMSDQEGIPIGEVLTQLMEAVRCCHVMVGHNLSFDFDLILNELYRLERFDDVSYVEAMKTYCTMKQAQKLLYGRDSGGIKLGDALELLTGEELGAAAHHAAADVEACRKVYEVLLDSGWEQEDGADAAGAAAGDEAAAAGAP